MRRFTLAFALGISIVSSLAPPCIAREADPSFGDSLQSRAPAKGASEGFVLKQVPSRTEDACAHAAAETSINDIVPSNTPLSTQERIAKIEAEIISALCKHSDQRTVNSVQFDATKSTEVQFASYVLQSRQSVTGSR